MTLIALKRALRPGGVSTGLIKGESSNEPGAGLVPGYSASGQDVWLPLATHFGPGLILSAVGARCGKVFQADGAWSVVANTVVLTPEPGHDPRFLWYLTNDENFWEKGGTAQPYVRVPDTLARKVWLPTLAVQRTIADHLDRETARIDALIEKKQRMIELLQLRTESLIAANLDPAITRWGEAPLKSVAKLAVSNVDKKSYDGQVPVKLCNYTDVYYNRRITNQLDFMSATADAQQVQRLTLHAGDVLITKDSETADDIAVPALVQEDLPGVVLGYHLALIRPTSVNGDFLYWAIRSRRSRDAFSLAASGVTRVGLRQDAMGRVPIPAVPSAMQSDLTEAIERDVGLGEDAVRKLSAQANLLRERRQALITSAVTGEFEVPGVAA